VPQAVHGSLLAISGVELQIYARQQPCKHLAKCGSHVFVFAFNSKHKGTVPFFEEFHKSAISPSRR